MLNLTWEMRTTSKHIDVTFWSPSTFSFSLWCMVRGVYCPKLKSKQPERLFNSDYIDAKALRVGARPD